MASWPWRFLKKFCSERRSRISAKPNFLSLESYISGEPAWVLATLDWAVVENNKIIAEASKEREKYMMENSNE